MGVGRARGKLLLFGEHAAVYGHPAVGLALPWGLEAQVEAGAAWSFPGLGPYEEALRVLVARLEVLAAGANLPAPAPGRLSLVSDLPLGSGYGSSGALCAALVNLFWPHQSLEVRDRLAWQAEHQFHGTPSGIDTSLALREGWWALDPGVKPPRARPLADPGLTLVTGSLVRTGDTKALVGSLARRRRAGDSTVTSSLDHLGALAAEAIAVLEAGLPAPAVGQALGTLALRAREGLASLGLESPGLTRVLDAAMSCPGALGAKLSGAGGGGAFFALFGSPAEAEAGVVRIRGAVDQGEWAAEPRLL